MHYEHRLSIFSDASFDAGTGAYAVVVKDEFGNTVATSGNKVVAIDILEAEMKGLLEALRISCNYDHPIVFNDNAALIKFIKDIPTGRVPFKYQEGVAMAKAILKKESTAELRWTGRENNKTADAFAVLASRRDVNFDVAPFNFGI